MSTLAQYVARQVLVYTAMVMALLLALIGLYLFLDQTNELGTGRYGVVEAVIVVLCRIPSQAFMLLPVGALMGSMLALGNLARNGELVVMRAAGVSAFRIGGWVMIAGALLASITWIIGDYVAPPAEQFATQYKLLTKTNQLSQPDSDNLWAKDGNTFVFIQKQDGQGALGGVFVLRFDDEHRLQSLGKAESAHIGADQQWRLKNYVESSIGEQGVVRTEQPELVLKTNLSGEYLGAASADPESLTGKALRSYIAYLEKNHLETTEYRTAFWARIARTAALLIIVVLAVPFSFGPMRSTGTGARMVIGILIGAMFFLMAKLLANGGVVYGIDPLIVAWGPTLVLTVVSVIALARVK